MGHRYAHFEFDPHALHRMRQRNVSRRQVIRTITNPDSLYFGHSGRLVAEYKTQAGNMLTVVFEEHPHVDGISAYVVTVIRKGTRR
jgi:hypothetical protein